MNPKQKLPDKGDQVPSGFARLDAESLPSFAPGSVWLVGAGPGAPGLLTLLGYHALQQADVVIYDALVNDRILDWVREGATVEYAGKRGGKPSAKQQDISVRLIELARQNQRVLRLKGGDPLVFGRGGEECQMLAEAGIPFRIVPGISAGTGGLAYAGIPSTHRDTNQSVLFLTGHNSQGQVPDQVDWREIATNVPVIVMFMAVRNLPAIASRLLDHGRDPHDPLAVVSNASLPEQSVYHTELGKIGNGEAMAGLPTPALVVIGPVVNFRAQLDWYTAALRESEFG